MDRLGWAVGLSAACYGVRIGLRATSADGLAELQSGLPRALKPGRALVVDILYSLVVGGPGARPGERRFHVLYRDAARLARSLDMAEIRRAFERDLSIAIGDAARRRVFVHAGVVGVNGGAILIPGKSCSGKTTLVQALVAQGGVYYSDDYAVLDGRGRVFPWAEPLSLRERGPTRASERHTPESLGMAPGRKGLPVRLVVLTSFQKGRAFSPREETQAAGTLGLLQHTLPARRRPRAALKALAAAVSGARVISGPRGEARAAARSILAKLNSPQGA